MSANSFTEGVRPGGLTSGTEIRILLCYLLDKIDTPIRREQIEESLLGEELANYFIIAESFASLMEQGLATQSSDGYVITDKGRTVARTLAQDVPKTVRDAAVRSVIRSQQYAANLAAHYSKIEKTDTGRNVVCRIGDDSGILFKLELYMPDDLSAEAVREKFINNGDDVYKLVLAALTDNRNLAEKALEKLK